MEVRLKRLFFKNVFDSGIVEVWFKGITYALVTSAFTFLYLNGHTEALPFALFSYLFTGLQVIHGSRKPYEYLKEIYVYPQGNRVISKLIYALFLYVRLQIIFSPFQVMLWAQESGKLPV